MTTCKWIRNDGTQCVLNRVFDKNYCNLHKKFEDLYHPDILNTLKRCKRCKKISETLNEKNKCLTCTNRQQRMIEKRKENKKKCEWINQKGEPCPFKTMENESFCKHHLKYKNQILSNLIKCSTCRNMFEQKNNEKICNKCKEISKQNRIKFREKQHLCEAIVKSTGKQCSYKSISENNYCKKHQTYRKIKELEENGFKLCRNKTRGCTNILDEDDKSKCKTCKLLANDNKSSTSIYNTKIENYKSDAKRRNIDWKLDKEQALNLVKSPCNYCNYYNGLNGIDRLDSNEGYIIENVVSCCKYCNIMKHTYSISTFENIIKHLYDSLNNNVINSENIIHFEKSYYKSYNTYKSICKQRKLIFDINETDYYNITNSKCHYCLLFENGCGGIDRINSNKGYFKSNIVPCCKTCNIMKNDLHIECFKFKIKNIYNYFILKKNVSYDSPKCKLLNLMVDKNYKLTKYKPLKMIRDEEFYLNKIFRGDINDVKNIKLSIEIVDSNDDNYSIWQFYRRYISSFKKKSSSTLVGRKIYILIKDDATQTYLGIISLSSDIKYLKARDNFIGWDSKKALLSNKLNYIMNISTCVSTQPFGHNFNGGKLLTNIVFSKEVLTAIKDKYNTTLQGYTTMSLYGKSIQYDRLKRIKFVGYTSGSSISNIPEEIITFCKTLQPENKDKLNDNLWLLTNTFKKFDLPVEDFLKTHQKGIYFGYTHKDSKQFLNNEIECPPNSIDAAPSLYHIFNEWLQRWAIKRDMHLHKTNRVKSFDECKSDIMNQLKIECEQLL